MWKLLKTNVENIIFDIKDWIFYKFYYKSKDEVDIYLLDSLLKIHKLNRHELLKNPMINGIQWYQYYTWTSKEEKSFYKKMEKYLKKHSNYTDYAIKSHLNFFLLMYGYKTKD